MGFIEKFFGKSDIYTIDERDISSFVARKIEENLNLEYKHSKTLKKPEELAITISSFANSTGGLLIVGISEIKQGQKRLPDAIVWDNERSHNREWFETVVVNHIHPALDNVRILPIRSIQGTVFLVDVPVSLSPPHMAPDYRYYYRTNFHTLPMEHYQVADLFGKRRRPILHPFLEISDFKSENEQMALGYGAKNIGKASARWPHIQITIRNCFIGETIIDGQHYEKILEPDGSIIFVISYLSNNEIIHPSFELDIKPTNIKLEKSLAVINIMVGAEEATTDTYIAIIGKKWLTHNFKTIARPTEARVPLFKLETVFQKHELVDWLDRNLGADILAHQKPETPRLQLGIMGEYEVDLSEIFEEVVNRRSVKY